MSFPATVFNVLIASPSDVPDERDIIAQSLHDWNALHSEETGKVLLPVMWESHSAPVMGDRPQAVINSQVVRSCDMLIGAFWTRLGSPTGVEESGTVEEIKWFLSKKKPVMLYFSNAPIVPGKLDTKQFEKLNTFKEEIRNKGLQWHYDSHAELRQSLLRQITIVMREIDVGPVVDSRAVKKASDTQQKVEANAVRSLDLQNEGGIYFESYTDRSFVVRGKTIDLRDQLRKLGGRWIKGQGWMFSKRHLDKVAKELKLPATLR